MAGGKQDSMSKKARTVYSDARIVIIGKNYALTSSDFLPVRQYVRHKMSKKKGGGATQKARKRKYVGWSQP